MMQIMFQLFTDVWRLAKESGACRLTDEQWEAFHTGGERLLAKYRACDHDMELLFRDMFGALQAFYRRKGRGNGDREKQ